MAQFNTVIKNELADQLHDAGFVLLTKTKHPYYVRLINNEFLHVISYRQLCARRIGEKTIEYLGGIVSLYRQSFEYPQFPPHPDDMLMPMLSFYRESHPDIDIHDPIINEIYHLQCCAEAEEDMRTDIHTVITMIKKHMIPFLDQIQTLENCVEYFRVFQPFWIKLDTWENFIDVNRYQISEGLLLILTDDRSDGIERMENEITKEIPFIRSQDDITKLREKTEKRRIEQNKFRDDILDTPALRRTALEEAQRRKIQNMEWLKQHGLK